MEEVGGGTRVAYGSHWWMLDGEGTVLVYDEDRDEWDLWEGKPDDPLPPPEFFGVARVHRPKLAFLESPLLLKVLFALFLVAAIVYLILQTWVALIQEQGFSANEPSELLVDLVYFFLPLARAAWETTVGALLALTAFNVHRYIREKRARDEDPRSFVPKQDQPTSE